MFFPRSDHSNICQILRAAKALHRSHLMLTTGRSTTPLWQSSDLRSRRQGAPMFLSSGSSARRQRVLHQIALLPETLSLTRFPQFFRASSQTNHEQKERSFHSPTSNKHWRCPWNASPLSSCLIAHTDKTRNEHWGEPSKGTPPLETAPPSRSFTQSSFTLKTTC